MLIWYSKGEFESVCEIKKVLMWRISQVESKIKVKSFTFDGSFMIYAYLRPKSQGM